MAYETLSETSPRIIVTFFICVWTAVISIHKCKNNYCFSNFTAIKKTYLVLLSLTVSHSHYEERLALYSLIVSHSHYEERLALFSLVVSCFHYEERLALFSLIVSHNHYKEH